VRVLGSYPGRDPLRPACVDFERLARPGAARTARLRSRPRSGRAAPSLSPRQLVELGSNENPYGASPRARDAIQRALDEHPHLSRSARRRLKRALAAHHGVQPANLLLGNGSHELLMQFAQCSPGQAMKSSHRSSASRCTRSPRRPRAHAFGSGTCITARKRNAARSRPGCHCALASARARWSTWPTPTIRPAPGIRPTLFEAFMALGAGSDVVVVVDEAYAEFTDAPDYASALPLVTRHPNLVVTRTFSKAYALAGLRVGFAVATMA
jgi:histidinol-phosphate aminotransferase